MQNIKSLVMNSKDKSLIYDEQLKRSSKNIGARYLKKKKKYCACEITALLVLLGLSVVYHSKCTRESAIYTRLCKIFQSSHVCLTLFHPYVHMTVGHFPTCLVN